MPLAVIENIADTLYDRLAAMVGDSTNYPTDVSEVVRPTRFANFTPRDRQIILTEGIASPVPELSCPGNPPAVAIAQQFNIRLHMMPSERNTDAIGTIMNQFVADVRKCVCQPASSWHTMGGYAIISQFEQHRPFMSDGGLDGCNLQLLVTYRVSEDDPTEQR